MKVSIESRPDARYSLTEADCLRHENGTLFKCVSGDLFMVVQDYRSWQNPREGAILIMFSEGGPSRNINWAESGYRSFKLIGKVDIEFKYNWHKTDLHE